MFTNFPAIMCPKLNVPENGAVEPSSCSERDMQFGMECFIHCNEGYELKGPRFLTCQEDHSWTDMAPMSCEKGKYKKHAVNYFFACTPVKVLNVLPL